MTLPFSAGEHVGPYYRIVSPIGSGGMGEVYKAQDTRLGRDVAIKVSTLAFNERFEREGRAVAALNHPNGFGSCKLHRFRRPDGRPPRSSAGNGSDQDSWLFLQRRLSGFA
jgi:serine/threonine protein kinase